MEKTMKITHNHSKPEKNVMPVILLAQSNGCVNFFLPLYILYM